MSSMKIIIAIAQVFFSLACVPTTETHSEKRSKSAPLDDTFGGGSSDGMADGSSDVSTDGSSDVSTDGSSDVSTDGSSDVSTDGSSDGSADGSSDGTPPGFTRATFDYNKHTAWFGAVAKGTSLDKAIEVYFSSLATAVTNTSVILPAGFSFVGDTYPGIGGGVRCGDYG
jgi:hypothetical protein